MDLSQILADLAAASTQFEEVLSSFESLSAVQTTLQNRIVARGDLVSQLDSVYQNSRSLMHHIGYRVYDVQVITAPAYLARVIDWQSLFTQVVNDPALAEAGLTLILSGDPILLFAPSTSYPQNIFGVDQVGARIGAALQFPGGAADVVFDLTFGCSFGADPYGSSGDFLWLYSARPVRVEAVPRLPPILLRTLRSAITSVLAKVLNSAVAMIGVRRLLALATYPAQTYKGVALQQGIAISLFGLASQLTGGLSIFYKLWSLPFTIYPPGSSVLQPDPEPKRASPVGLTDQVALNDVPPGIDTIIRIKTSSFASVVQLDMTRWVDELFNDQVDASQYIFGNDSSGPHLVFLFSLVRGTEYCSDYSLTWYDWQPQYNCSAYSTIKGPILMTGRFLKSGVPGAVTLAFVVQVNDRTVSYPLPLGNAVEDAAVELAADYVTISLKYA